MNEHVEIMTGCLPAKDSTKPVECQHHTLREMAHLIRNGVPIANTERSRHVLSEWLEELAKARNAIYEARCALAKSDP